MQIVRCVRYKSSMEVCILLGTHLIIFVIHAISIKIEMLNIDVSKQLNQCIQPQPDEITYRKAKFILDLIKIKENPVHNFDMSHINELLNYLCIV